MGDTAKLTLSKLLSHEFTSSAIDPLSHPGPTFWCCCLKQARCQQQVVVDSISIDILDTSRNK